MTNWYDDRDELCGLLRHMIDNDPDCRTADDVLAVVEKPWHFTQDWQAWANKTYPEFDTVNQLTVIPRPPPYGHPNNHAFTVSSNPHEGGCARCGLIRERHP